MAVVDGGGRERRDDAAANVRLPRGGAGRAAADDLDLDGQR
jgi:hypothetical protein